jgi:hypothetical protein
MLQNPQFESPYGNLQFYKYYLRSHVNKIFESNGANKAKTKHKQHVFGLLKILALKGASTTWDAAKVRFTNDLKKVREKEKEYRRLLVGRVDRGKYSSGLLDLCLVVRDGKSEKNKHADKYRLSLHGILYCLDVLGFNDKEIDVMASNYAHVLPKIFGKWNFLKSVVAEEVYTIKILARGLLLDNKNINDSSTIPIYELMSFVNTKYHKNFEQISEERLADQISYWFYTNLLYQDPTQKTSSIQKIKKIFAQNDDLKNWYLDFVRETSQHYKTSLENLQKIKL